MNKAQRKHYEKLVGLGCALCRHLGYGETMPQIHHIRRLGMKRNNSPVIPLCFSHHTGNDGVHGLGKKSFAERYGVTEEDLLAQTEALI